MDTQTIYYKRKAQDYLVKFLAWIATLFGLFFLSWILWVTFSKGFNAFGSHLFTQMTPPPGEETGGLLNALVGSLMMGMLSNGLILMGLSVSWQMIIKGLIVLAAVAVSLREPNR